MLDEQYRDKLAFYRQQIFGENYSDTNVTVIENKRILPLEKEVESTRKAQAKLENKLYLASKARAKLENKLNSTGWLLRTFFNVVSSRLRGEVSSRPR